MTRAVLWSSRALRDLKDQVEFIAYDNIDASGRVAQVIRKSGNDLGRFATGRPGRISGLFEKSVPRLPYIIVYRIREESIVILRVIHTARDWRGEV